MKDNNYWLRRVFGPRRESINKDWRKVHTVELYNLCK
jgi:hypothetical protein